MQLQRVKMIVAATWALSVFLVAIVLGMSGLGLIAVTAIALVPPLALLLLWNEPAPTMSESITQARR